MKSFKTNFWVAAAALTIAAGGASAQSIKAEIPFAFQAGSATLAPGTYRVTKARNGAPLLQIVGMNDSATIIGSTSSAPKKWVKSGSPMLSFECVETRCTLAKVWDGESRDLYDVLPAKNNNRDAAGVRVVRVEAAKAD